MPLNSTALTGSPPGTRLRRACARAPRLAPASSSTVDTRVRRVAGHLLHPQVTVGDAGDLRKMRDRDDLRRRKRAAGATRRPRVLSARRSPHRSRRRRSSARRPGRVRSRAAPARSATAHLRTRSPRPARRAVRGSAWIRNVTSSISGRTRLALAELDAEIAVAEPEGCELGPRAASANGTAASFLAAG